MKYAQGSGRGQLLGFLTASSVVSDKRKKYLSRVILYLIQVSNSKLPDCSLSDVVDVSFSVNVDASGSNLRFLLKKLSYLRNSQHLIKPENS